MKSELRMPEGRGIDPEIKDAEKPNTRPSLPESFATVSIPGHPGAGFGKKMLAFIGPGLMVAVGYMDPGNWATDIEGGSRFGYKLLSVILLSNLFAMVLQYLSLKLGIATGHDLAQACRERYPKPVAIILWILAEIAIAATDLAEVIGSAIALNLLFNIPLPLGVLLTGLDVLLILYLQHKGFRILESIVAGLIAVIFVSFLYEMILSQPSASGMLLGLIPSTEIVTNPSMLYIAIGILGATVMPHNLYLHSSIVQTRAYAKNESGRSEAIKFATIDSTVSLFLAFLINGSILVLAAAAFYTNGHREVSDISDAYLLLEPTLGAKLAPVFFGVALLAAGLNSTLTGTLAGQIVMEGFLHIRLKPWLRRLVTRLIAIVPAMIVAVLYGAHGASELLVLSQVILSVQLSFAVVPLVIMTCDRKYMGRFTNSNSLKWVSGLIALVIISLNLLLLRGFFS